MNTFLIGKDIITGRDKRLDKKTGKYRYEKILQGNYGQGWEDLTAYDCDYSGWIKDKKVRQEKNEDIKAYKENEPQYSHRVIVRKIAL